MMQLNASLSVARNLLERVLVFISLPHSTRAPFADSANKIIPIDGSFNLIRVPVHEIYVNGCAGREEDRRAVDGHARLLISFMNINFTAGDCRDGKCLKEFAFVAIFKESHH